MLCDSLCRSGICTSSWLYTSEGAVSVSRLRERKNKRRRLPAALIFKDQNEIEIKSAQKYMNRSHFIMPL